MSNIFCGPLWLSILQRFCEVSGGGKKWGFFSWLSNFFCRLRRKKNYQPRKKPPLFFHLRSLRKKLQNINQGGRKNIITLYHQIVFKSPHQSNNIYKIKFTWNRSNNEDVSLNQSFTVFRVQNMQYLENSPEALPSISREDQGGFSWCREGAPYLTASQAMHIYHSYCGLRRISTW